MNVQDVTHLLGICSAIDPKLPQPDRHVVAAWHAMLEDVPADQAGHIVRFYYRSERYLVSREPISPADIVQAWNARRRPSEREREGVPRAARRALPRPPVDPEVAERGMAKVLAALGAAKGLDEDAAESEALARRAVRSVACPHCKAGVNQPCVQPTTGQVLRRRGAHPAREEAAFAKGPTPHTT